MIKCIVGKVTNICGKDICCSICDDKEVCSDVCSGIHKIGEGQTILGMCGDATEEE